MDSAVNQVDHFAAPSKTTGRARSLAIIATLFALQLADGIDQTALAFAAPSLSAELRLGPVPMGAAFSAGFIGTALGSILFGTIGDRIGRKFALCIAAICFSLGSFSTIFVHTGGALFAVRLATGIALGGLFPIVASVILDTVSREMRATAITIVSVGTAAGAALCGPIFALMEPHAGWRSIFILGSVVPAIFVLIAFLLIPPTPRVEHAPGAPGVSNPLQSVLTLFAGGRWRLTLTIWVAFIASAVPMFFSLSWLPTFALSARLDHGAAALSPAIFSLSGLITAIVVARIIDRVGIRALAILSALGVPALMLLGFAFGSKMSLLAACAFAGAISVSCVNLMGAIAAILYEDGLRTRGVGWAVAIMRIGGAIAPGLGGVLIAYGLTPPQIFTMLAIGPAITALAIWRLSRPKPVAI